MESVYFYVGAYVVVLMVLSWIVSRRQNEEDFFIAGRRRGGWQILASKFAAAIGAGYFITYTGFAYEYGPGVFSLVIGIVVGYFVFAYWASPKIYGGSKEKKFYTMGDFVRDRTGSGAAKNLANAVSMVILFAWLLTGIIGGAKIIDDFGFLSYDVAVFLTASVVLVYILLAGFRAVILTDALQSFIIIALLAFVTFGMVGSGGLAEVLTSQNAGIDFSAALGFFLFGVLGVFSYSDRYQLSYAAKDGKNLKHGIGLAIIPVMIVAFLLLIIGNFVSSKIPGLDSGLVFTEALKNFLHPSLLPLAVVLFFAGIMSSADTNVYGISSHYADSAGKWNVKTIRKATVFLMAAVSILAISFPDVVDASLVAGAVTLTLSFPMIYLFFNGKKPFRFVASCMGGIAGMILGISIFGLEPIAAVFPALFGALGLLWRENFPRVEFVE